MRLANSTTKTLRNLSLPLLFIMVFNATRAQENSPYSRYGIGDLAPNQNMASRQMGGISVADSSNLSINMGNPAAYGFYRNIIFDVGVDITGRRLKNNNAVQKFTSVNTNFSYLQIGFPLASEKMVRKGVNWGMVLGLKPFSRVNYKISTLENIPGLDTAATVYEGQGGINQAHIGTALKIKNFSFGISGGYSFGSKDYVSRRILKNTDSALYTSGQFINNNLVTGGFLELGLMYRIPMKNRSALVLGASTKMKQNLKVSSEVLRTTYYQNSDFAYINIDTVSYTQGVKNTAVLPAMYNIGFSFSDSTHWMFGAELNLGQWKDYRFANMTEPSENNYVIRAGVQYMPFDGRKSRNSYWDFATYRAGGYYGKDYLSLRSDNTIYGVSLGASLPLTTALSTYRTGDAARFNAGVEFGGRGSGNDSFKESIYRINLGLTVNGTWFIKRKYN